MTLTLQIRKVAVLCLLLLAASASRAQINTPAGTNNPANDPNNPFATDTSNNKKKMGNDWVDEQARIWYNYYNSSVKHTPDTSLHSFHHYQPVQPWWGRDLGNLASPTQNLFFTPDQTTGPQLGYHAWDLQKITLDSLPFFNTTRPYSSFRFMLGSKTEQKAEILHTQNINPDWNFAFHFRNINSPGFFAYQMVTNNSGSFNTQYASTNQRYQMTAAFVYNKFNNDENGGIVSEDDLTNPSFSNRQLLEVNFPFRSSTRSAVMNSFRTWDFYLQNTYAWGRADTLYNEDSTAATYRFTPRFRLRHQLLLHGEKHEYRDALPDSSTYASFGDFNFTATDTIQSIQNWFSVENKFSLNGYLGKAGGNLALVEAGVANRIDRFSTYFRTGGDTGTRVNNYIFGQIQKEAVQEGGWDYQALARFFFAGTSLGDFDLNASIGKSIKGLGELSLGLRQTLSTPSYTQNYFYTAFYGFTNDFAKVSNTKLWANLAIPRLRIEGGVRNYLIANYIFYDSTFMPQQQSEAFSVLQVYGRKLFVYKGLRFDNEVVWQQPTANAPVNLPAFMLRHQLGYEGYVFKNALKVAAGLEVRYHTPYFANGYTPYFNQFYVQDKVRVSNPFEATVYLNFKVGNFRCFVSFDQLQQYVFTKNVINAPGYPAQSALFRFGFNWVLIN